LLAACSSHDYLNVSGDRLSHPLIDLARVDPDFHNSAEQLWQKFISQHDQIFMVLCGHHHGQSYRVDKNAEGNPVYQVLADYQGRGQAVLDAGVSRRVGLGDGWLRLMTFDFATQPGTITVKTFSSHYNHYSSDMNQYADWYKAREQPGICGGNLAESGESGVWGGIWGQITVVSNIRKNCYLTPVSFLGFFLIFS
jgi:hypothetical protein